MKKTKFLRYGLAFVLAYLLGTYCLTAGAAPTKLGGMDELSKLSAAGNLIKTVDSFLFTVVARILAGLSILAAGWNLKEQRFAMAIICVFGAIIIATVPLWVDNIFKLSSTAKLF